MHCRTNGGALYYHLSNDSKKYKVPALELDRMIKNIKGADPGEALAAIDSVVVSVGARDGPVCNIPNDRFSGLPQVAVLMHNGSLTPYEEKRDQK